MSLLFCYNSDLLLVKVQIRLGLSRHVSTRLMCRASHAVLFKHGRRRTSYCAPLYIFSCFYSLTCTNLICSVKWNKINVYFNKVANNLHVITLYKFHIKLSCESRLSCRASRAWHVERVKRAVSSGSSLAFWEARHSQNAWAQHVKGVVVMSRRDEPSGI